MRVLLVPDPSLARAWDRVLAELRAADLDLAVVEAANLDETDTSDVDIVAGPGTLPCGADLFARSPRLSGLVSVATGYEGFDRKAAEARGIRIANGATRESTVGMASAAVMLLLALCHDLPAAEQALRDNRRRDISRLRPLDDMAVGIIGWGPIGREVARRLRAWDVRVLATSPSHQSGIAKDGTELAELDRLLAESDAVSLHAALTPASWHLLDRERIARMKPGALIVNTSRGGLIDEDSLVDALNSGQIGGAALDCFEHEPLPPESPLRRAPNIILTPHQIGHTAPAGEARVRVFIDNVLRLAALVRGVTSMESTPS